jgi:hypothetical protein
MASVPKTLIVSIAKDLYIQGGQIEGHDLDNWLMAEKAGKEIIKDAIIEETNWLMELRT